MIANFLGMSFGDVEPETDEEIIARRTLHDDVEFKKARDAYFSAVCPIEYREFNAELCKNMKAHVAVKEAIIGRKSVIVIGRVGTGKTFSVWDGLKTLIYVGLNPMVYTGVSFNSKASASAGSDEGSNDWIERVYDTNLLVIDDWAKEAVTEAQERLFFEVTEKRSAQRRQTVLVTNRTAREIVEQQVKAGRNTSRTEDILRRLVQRFTPIKFG